MKKLLLLAIICISAWRAEAQFGTCTPNQIYNDSLFGVYPPPYNDSLMTGGINESACINKPYSFVLNFHISDSITFNGTTIPLNYVRLEPTGAVTGLPVGMTYACNPPNCKFDHGAVGCAVIYGTATSANVPGDFPLLINGFISIPFFNEVPVTVPDQTGGLPALSGTYTLVVEPENSANCYVVGTEDLLEHSFAMSNSPNPFSDQTEIFVISKYNEGVTFSVFDIYGKLVTSHPLQLSRGENFVTFDGTALDSGIYLYTISKKGETVTGKMVVNH